MLDHCQSKEERWEGVQHLINNWLAERQELVVIYCALSNLSDLSISSATCLNKLGQFCQILVDYTSAGHFEVYDQLLTEAQSYNDGSAALLDKLYPRIAQSTEIFVNFNDTYDTTEHCEKAMGRLKAELSIIGEEMATRFSLEDELIDALHKAHAPQFA